MHAEGVRVAFISSGRNIVFILDSLLVISIPKRINHIELVANGTLAVQNSTLLLIEACWINSKAQPRQRVVMNLCNVQKTSGVRPTRHKGLPYKGIPVEKLRFVPL